MKRDEAEKLVDDFLAATVMVTINQQFGHTCPDSYYAKQEKAREACIDAMTRREADRHEMQIWRDDALIAAARIAERYGATDAATDIAALIADKSIALPEPPRHVEIPADNYYLRRYAKLADTPTPKSQQGTWTLTAPDGRQWQADSPLKACAAEQRERVPADVGLARIMREVNSPEGKS